MWPEDGVQVSGALGRPRDGRICQRIGKGPKSGHYAYQKLECADTALGHFHGK